MIKDLTAEQWEALQAHLSKPLDDDGKQLILDFLDFELINYALDQVQNFKTPTPATLIHEIVAFKETAQSLIPKQEINALERGIHLFTPLPIEAQKNLDSAWLSLSLYAKAAIGDELYLMTRTDTAKQLYHPSQYDIAAKLALEKLPNPQKGGGNPLSAFKEEHFYTSIFKLWRNLGEVNFGISHNPDHKQTSPLVSFTHAIEVARKECIKRYNEEAIVKANTKDTIRKGLAKYRNLIPVIKMP